MNHLKLVHSVAKIELPVQEERKLVNGMTGPEWLAFRHQQDLDSRARAGKAAEASTIWMPWSFSILGGFAFGIKGLAVGFIVGYSIRRLFITEIKYGRDLK